MKSSYVKIVLLIIIGVCILKMPYGYYGFARVVSMIGFIYLAIESKWYIEKIIFTLLVILFQPFFKFIIHKQEWIYIDIIVVILLVISIVFNFLKSKPYE